MAQNNNVGYLTSHSGGVLLATYLPAPTRRIEFIHHPKCANATRLSVPRGEILNKLKRFKYVSKEYSPTLATLYSLSIIATRLGKLTGWYPGALYRAAACRTGSMVLAKYRDFIEAWSGKSETATDFAAGTRPPAWVCWLQGYEQAPDLVKRLIDIQKRHLPEYDYHLITTKNLDSFVDLPGFIFDAAKEGRITPVHFTDILRAALLRDHGGLWLDATLLVTHNISLDYVNYPFFSIKGLNMDFPGGVMFPEVGFWEGYFIAGKKNALFYDFMYNFFLEYWKGEDQLVQYFLINQVAKLGIRHIATLAREYATIPQTNQSCELLSPRLIKSEPLLDLPQYGDGTSVFKLSRRASYNQESLKRILLSAADTAADRQKEARARPDLL